MDLALAIKDEEGIAPSFLSGGAFLTGLLDLTVYRCPHCRSVYKVIPGPGDVFLGKGQRTCAKCQKAFRDRSKEWPVTSSIDRFLFLFPMVVGGWVLFTFVVACLLFFYGNSIFGNSSLLLLLIAAFVLPLIGWFVVRSYQIVRSIRRSNLIGKTKVV
jgi:hypothetical protein